MGPYIEVYDLVELAFVNGVRKGSRVHPFACGNPSVPAPFVEKTVLSPGELSGHLG